MSRRCRAAVPILFTATATTAGALTVDPIFGSGFQPGLVDATYEAQHFYNDSFEASFLAPAPGEYWCFGRAFATIYMGVMTVQ